MAELIATALTLVLGILFGAFLVHGRDERERRFIWISLVAHQVSAVLMVVLTTYYYGGGDMTNYHYVGKFIASRLRADFFDLAPALLNVLLQRERTLPLPGALMGSNTGSMQAMSGFLVYIFQDSLYAVCLAIASASTAAKVMFLDLIKQELPTLPRGQLYFACLLVPSTVFWSSGLLKEPLAMIGLTLALSGGHQLVKGRKVLKGGLLLGAGIMIAGLFKGYVVPAFGLASGMWLLARTIQRRYGEVVVQTRFLIGAVVLGIGTIVLTGLALPQFAPETLADEARSAQEIGARVSGGSNYQLGQGATLGGQLPLAIATVLFRPLVLEANNPLVFLNGLEMLWITWMFVVALFRRPFIKTLGIIISSPGLAFCVAFVSTLAVGVGLTTTNLGTLSRYRMPLMPFYAVLLVAVASRTLQRMGPLSEAIDPAGHDKPSPLLAPAGTAAQLRRQ